MKKMIIEEGKYNSLVSQIIQNFSFTRSLKYIDLIRFGLFYPHLDLEKCLSILLDYDRNFRDTLLLN